MAQLSTVNALNQRERLEHLTAYEETWLRWRLMMRLGGLNRDQSVKLSNRRVVLYVIRKGSFDESTVEVVVHRIENKIQL